MKDEKIKLSVIMLAYNQTPYIGQAIESVLAQQTEFAFEVLIGDDASTDTTAQIIRAYAREYPETVIPVIRETNIGATRNLYDLITRAKGDYLAYLECDDLWRDNTKLQQQVDFLEAHPNYIACTHPICVIDQEGNPRDCKIHWISDQEEYRLSDFDGILLPGHGNSLVHRNIFQNSQDRYREFMTLHPMIADRVLALLLASFGPIRQLPKTMGCYRCPTVASENATAVLFDTNPEKTLDDYLLTKKIEEYAVGKLGIPADLSPHRKRLLFYAVWDAFRKPGKNNFKVAFKILRYEHSPAAIFYVIRSVFRKITDKIKKGLETV